PQGAEALRRGVTPESAVSPESGTAGEKHGVPPESGFAPKPRVTPKRGSRLNETDLPGGRVVLDLRRERRLAGRERVVVGERAVNVQVPGADGEDIVLAVTDRRDTGDRIRDRNMAGNRELPV